MTENSTENSTENTTTEAQEAPVWSPPNDVARAIFGEIVAQTDEYNSLQRKIDAATGDVTPLLEDLRRNSDDENVVKMRAKYDDLILKAEKIIAEMNDYLRQNVLATEKMSDDEITAAQTLLTKIRADIKAGTNFLTSRFGDEAASAVPTLLGTKTRKSSGTGEGGRKPRVSTIYVDGVPATAEVKQKDGSTKIVSTFTLAAKSMGGVAVPDIHAAYFAAAGTTDLDAVPDSVEFVLSHGDKNYTVRVDK